VTINLVDVACSAEGDEEKFWKLMEERTELCHKALRIRHKTLLGTPSDVAPILWQYGAISRLAKGEKIDRLLYDNYSTISLGYAGLSECVYRMKGCSHTDPEGHDFGIEVMKFMNRKTAQWREAENISYSLYGTPMESSTYKFARCLRGALVSFRM
jgi:ribonucleoside-triphosphate reductase